MVHSGSWLDSFTGQHVTVLTSSSTEEKSDTGTLVKIAEGWLQVVKDNGEMVLVPATAVRLIKLLDLTQTVTAVDPTARLSTTIYEPNAQTL